MSADRNPPAGRLSQRGLSAAIRLLRLHHRPAGHATAGARDPNPPTPATEQHMNDEKGPSVQADEGRHYYPNGGWHKPFDCLHCHPWWYWGSAFLIGAGFWLLLLLVLSVSS